MMRRVALMTVLVVALGAIGSWAEDTREVVLKYAPGVGQHDEIELSVELRDVQLNAMPMELGFAAAGLVKLDVLKVDEATGNVTVRLSAEVQKAEFGGQPRQTGPLAPVEIVFTPRGEIVPPQTEGEQNDPTNPGLAALMEGRMPLDLVAQVVGIMRLPDQPVAVGETWTVEQSIDAPFIGATKALSKTTLVRMEGTQAVLRTQISAELPAGYIQIPGFAGGINLQSGKLRGDNIERWFCTERSVITRGTGELRAELMLDMGTGFAMPAAFTLAFELKPPTAENTGEGAAGQAAPAGQARARWTLRALLAAAWDRLRGAFGR